MTVFNKQNKKEEFNRNFKTKKQGPKFTSRNFFFRRISMYLHREDVNELVLPY